MVEAAQVRWGNCGAASNRTSTMTAVRESDGTSHDCGHHWVRASIPDLPHIHLPSSLLEVVPYCFWSLSSESENGLAGREPDHEGVNLDPITRPQMELYLRKIPICGGGRVNFGGPVSTAPANTPIIIGMITKKSTSNTLMRRSDIRDRYLSAKVMGVKSQDDNKRF